MTITEPVTAADRAEKQGTQAVRACRCGQELDVCSRSHCPRCGACLPT